MHALRFPLAACLGLFVALAVFTLLWSFIGRTTTVEPVAKSNDVKFTRQLIDTPVVTKRREKIDRPPEPAVPSAPSIQAVDKGDVRTGLTDVKLVRYEPYGTPVDLRHYERAAVGQDRDVIPIVRIAPDYPPKPLADQIEGWVKVQFTIAPTGTVRDAFVVESSPQTVFDAAALKAIARWRYDPKVEDGVPVERVGVQTIIRFRLQ